MVSFLVSDLSFSDIDTLVTLQNLYNDTIMHFILRLCWIRIGLGIDRGLCVYLCCIGGLNYTHNVTSHSHQQPV